MTYIDLDDLSDLPSRPALPPPPDPAAMGWPPTLPLEVALRAASPAEICDAYELSEEDWNSLLDNPAFIQEVADAAAALKKDGMSFKMKARLQSEELLKTSWALIHAPNDDVPPSVKADLIKFTIRAAGLDGSKDQAASQNQGPALSININLA